ncbi:hypothetical protein LQ757_05355 [Agromyces sp. SYSU K20354]|nr:hypothetical protein [Agromyces cavernae]MCD2441701.1 hypothetical protein [Agromyces cavernae]
MRVPGLRRLRVTDVAASVTRIVRRARPDVDDERQPGGRLGVGGRA